MSTCALCSIKICIYNSSIFSSSWTSTNFTGFSVFHWVRYFHFTLWLLFCSTFPALQSLSQSLSQPSEAREPPGAQLTLQHWSSTIPWHLKGISHGITMAISTIGPSLYHETNWSRNWSRMSRSLMEDRIFSQIQYGMVILFVVRFTSLAPDERFGMIKKSAWMYRKPVVADLLEGWNGCENRSTSGFWGSSSTDTQIRLKKNESIISSTHGCFQYLDPLHLLLSSWYTETVEKISNVVTWLHRVLRAWRWRCLWEASYVRPLELKIS